MNLSSEEGTTGPQTQAESSNAQTPSPAPSSAERAADPRFARPIRLISELVAQPDFPASAVGEHADIGGYTGVIMEIVRNSIKVRSSEGVTMSYNINALRRLYGPRPVEEPVVVAPVPEPEPPRPAPPLRKLITNPNFAAPPRPIELLVQRPDFPKCAFGEHIDLHGYSGVVVEIVGRSLKVRSPEGTSRSYNADGLRRIYPNPQESAGHS